MGCSAQAPSLNNRLVLHSWRAWFVGMNAQQKSLSFAFALKGCRKITSVPEMCVESTERPWNAVITLTCVFPEPHSFQGLPLHCAALFSASQYPLSTAAIMLWWQTLHTQALAGHNLQAMPAACSRLLAAVRQLHRTAGAPPPRQAGAHLEAHHAGPPLAASHNPQ